jgi:hypothetical protein
LIDTKNNEIFAANHDRIWVHPQVIILQKAEKMAMAKPNGEMLCDFLYDKLVTHKTYGCVVATKNNKVGLLNFKGEILVPLNYERYYWRRNGIAWLKKDNTLYMLDENASIMDSMLGGDLVISLTKNDPVGMFANGTVSYYNIKGESIGTDYKVYPDRSARGSEPNRFKNGLCVVYNGNHFGIINANNEIVIPFDYSYLSPPSKLGTCIAQKGDLNGLIDLENKTVLPFRKRPVRNYSILPYLQDAVRIDQELDSLLPRAKITAKQAISIAKEKKLLYYDTWNYQFYDYPKLKEEKGKVYWEIISTKTGYTERGNCAKTNGCSIIYKRIIKINAATGKVMSKKQTKSIFPNYE